jgi:predicted NAD/FAD-binding protein
VIGAVFATLLSLAQRLLSTQVRTIRRRAAAVTGSISYRDGREERIDADTLTRAPEKALKALAAATACLAIALIVLHLS